MNFLLQNQTRWVFVFLLLSLLSFPLLSEQTILLKIGTSIKANVTSQNEKFISIRTKIGIVQFLSKKGILNVINKDIIQEEAKRLRREEETKIQETNSVEDKKGIEDETIRSSVETQTTGIRIRWSLVWRSAVLPGRGL